MSYQIIQAGESFSFPSAHDFLAGGSKDGDITVLIGEAAGAAYVESADEFGDDDVVLIELGNECLGVHIGDDDGPKNVVGFARFRLGSADPTNLVELVRMPWTNEAAVQTARDLFTEAGLVVAVCQDFPGRILNKLIRPYYNAALRRLDEGLATAADMDATLRMGLGYPEGPIELLNRTGLEHHFEVTQDLYEQLGQEPYAPARRARTAWLRAQSGEES